VDAARNFSHDYEHKRLVWTDSAFGWTAAPFLVTACSSTCRAPFLVTACSSTCRINVRDSWNGATSFSVLSFSFCDYPWPSRLLRFEKVSSSCSS